MTGPPVLAADIGGTTMRAALVAPDGALLARLEGATEPARGIEDATARLIAMLREAAGPSSGAVAAVGVATAGPVDPSSGTYRHPPNLPGWDGESMQPALRAAFGVPVAVGHDATLAALAETRHGPHRGLRDLVYVTVSTGIGAGIIADGRMVTGAHGGAGEVGHMIVQPGGPACAAGCPGCLEGVASGAAIAAEAARRLQVAQASGFAGKVGDSPPDAAGVFRAAARGDTTSLEIVRGVVRHLGAGLASLLAIFDPERLVIGGGVARGLEPYWGELIEAVEAHALPRYADGVPVTLSELGDDIGLLGAAELAFDALASGA